MPRSVLLGERAPGERWTTRDRELAVALLQMEGALCSGCGQPSWLAHDEDTDWLQPEPVVCWSCKALSEAQESWSKGGGEDGVPHAHAYRWSIRQYRPEEHETGDE